MTLSVLQSTLAPEVGLPSDLYLKICSSEGAYPVQVALAGADGGLDQPLSRGEVLTTNTFFGAFYRSYWDAYTEIGSVSLSVQFSGAVIVRVFEASDRGNFLLCARELSQKDARSASTFALPLQPIGGGNLVSKRGSRIFVEVEAAEKSHIRAIEFLTDAAPTTNVELSVGLCTFNQEKFFAETLEKVTKLSESDARVQKIFVVNQGAPFESQKIQDLVKKPSVESIKQRNLGGCGGFTRSLDEALKSDAPLSHHLLMDDDIVLDPRLILRALQFLGFATRDVALGAGMLDAMRPTVMHEAGAFLRPENRIEAYCHNRDLSKDKEQDHFNAPVLTDYNAWWFCIVPLEKCRQALLPAPVFIRGDDFEYGQRLARLGVPTVTLPGIAVWHEPFYAKPSGWQDYYDLRNRLIFGATYQDKVRQLSLPHVIGAITNAILCHNYMAADLRMRAVEDFLAGPEALFSRDSEELHMSVMAMARTNAPEKLDNADWQGRPTLEGTKPAPVREMRVLVQALFVSFLRSGFGPHRKTGRPVVRDSDAHVRNLAGRAYVLTNVPRSYHLLFVPNRKKLFAQMFKAFKLALRYRREVSQVNKTWEDRMPEYRTAEWWRPVFGEGETPLRSQSEEAQKVA